MKNVMIPEGYEKLAAIGIAYKGVYEASREYGILSAVYHNGSTFVSLKDAPQGEPTGDGVNWQYLAKGFVESLLTSIQATDTSGIAGTAGELVNAQSLLDVIADRVANKLIDKNKIVNGLISTDATAVLAAPQGKVLKDEIGEVNRKLGAIKTYTVTSIGVWPIPTIQEKNGTIFIKYATTFGPAAAWASTTVGKITGWTYGDIGFVCPLHALYGEASSTVFLYIVANGDVVIATHAAAPSERWYYGTAAILVK